MSEEIGSSGQQTSTIQQAIDLAVQHHSSGDLREAESIYQQILQADPNQPVALHLLGVIAHQVGKNETAVELINKALQLSPNYVAAHSNLGNILQSLERMEEAAISCRNALDIDPDHLDAHVNLSSALCALGHFEDAIISSQKVLSINPNHAVAHNNLGNIFFEMGKLDEAVKSFKRALTIEPNLVDALCNLGTVLWNMGKFDQAANFATKASHISPNNATVHYTLGLAQQSLERRIEALTSFRRSVTIMPENNLFWNGLAGILFNTHFLQVDEQMFTDLEHLLERPTVGVSNVIRPIIRILKHHSIFNEILNATNDDSKAFGLSYVVAAEKLSTIPLLLKSMSLSPIYDLQIENMLTVLRRTLLIDALDEKISEKVLSFSAALALHCFANEYVFTQSPEEETAVEKLLNRIEIQVNDGKEITPLHIIALGAYRPLYNLPWAKAISVMAWDETTKAVIKRQTSEPLEEQAFYSEIPTITPINNTISISVREQYEEHPYPRWIKTGISDKARTIDAVLRMAPLQFDLGDYITPKNPDILVAGCGTGQQSINTASRFSNAQILAVDLSLSSLSYAIRKTKELGIFNIEYAQADILELRSIDRQFDVIECGGVLHHLENPLAGWHVLVDLLRPGGLTKIALYSETARQCVLEGRSHISEKGYSTSDNDIRKCRQDIMRFKDDEGKEISKLCNVNDFFSLSECRDLLFHVEEHRFTLPQIEKALNSLNLRFIGFEMSQQSIMTAFKEKYPRKQALTSLNLWHKFEVENPDIFSGMYQFWCVKI